MRSAASTTGRRACLWAYLRRLTNDRTARRRPAAGELLPVPARRGRSSRASRTAGTTSSGSPRISCVTARGAADAADVRAARRRDLTRPQSRPGHEAVTARVAVNEALVAARREGARAALARLRAGRVASGNRRGRRRQDGEREVAALPRPAANGGSASSGATRRHDDDAVLPARSRSARSRLDESVAGARRTVARGARRDVRGLPRSGARSRRPLAISTRRPPRT